MVGQRTVTKPSRSDHVLDADEQLRITNQIKAQFDSVAPKRPMKPNRSEPDSPTPALSVVDQTNIPELQTLRALQSQSYVVISDEGANIMVQDEFVDTQYYKELNSIDKQHHKTGTGFIRVEREEEGDSYDIQWTGIHGGSNGIVQGGFRSNPATNDWIPKTDEDLYLMDPVHETNMYPVNGVPACADKDLLAKVKDEWLFEGLGKLHSEATFKKCWLW